MHWFIKHLYAPAVRTTLRYRYLTLAIGVSALILTVGYIRSGRIRFTFFPLVESDRITASAVLPYGAPLAASRAVSERIQKAALDLIGDYGGDKVAIGVQTSLGSAASGGGPFSGPSASGSHLVGVTVYLEPLDKRGFSAREFTEGWRKAVGKVPGLESLSFKFTIGPSSRLPVDVQLTHRDPLTTEKAALAVADALRHFDGVFEIDDGVAHGKPQIEYHLTAQGQAMGLTSQEVGRQVRAAFYGAEVTRQQRGRDEMKAMGRLPQGERESETAVDTLMLRTPAGV